MRSRRKLGSTSKVTTNTVPPIAAPVWTKPVYLFPVRDKTMRHLKTHIHTVSHMDAVCANRLT